MERVQLESLSILDFRNIEHVKIAPGNRFNILSGDNGMGKTNVVESIYLLGALRSFRTNVRGEMVRHGREAAQVEGIFAGAEAGLRCELKITANTRLVKTDGKTVRPESAHFKRLPMVLFHPGNLDLVQGGPQVRRRFLDRALFQSESNYPGVLRGYNRALRCRNRLLRDKPLDRRAIAPFDQQIAELGARLREHRRKIVASLGPLFEEAFGEVSGVNRGGIRYLTCAEGDAGDLVEALEKSIDRDAERGFTSIGPHADDLELSMNGRATRRFASQGQQRATALALKIAETRALAHLTDKIPLLLLDDVSSELDESRNERLFEFLAGVGGQVFITTTHLDTIRVEDERTDFIVVDGEVEQKSLR